MSGKSRPLTVTEIMDLLENDDEGNDDIEGFYLVPPNPGVHSDEDSAEEDEGGKVDNLSRNQLLASGEIIRRGQRMDPELDSCEQRILFGMDNSEEDHVPKNQKANTKPKTVDKQVDRHSTRKKANWVSNRKTHIGNKRSSKRIITLHNDKTEEKEVVVSPIKNVKRGRTSKSTGDLTAGTTGLNNSNGEPKRKMAHKRGTISLQGPSPWTKLDLKPQQPMFPPEDYGAYKDKSPIELFELFFDSDVYELILQQSQIYSQFMNHPDPHITIEELKVFLGILFVSGYNNLPARNYYWDSGEDMKNDAVSQGMRRDRFTQIMKYLQFADNTEGSTTDKMWKIAPLISLVKINIMKHFVPLQNMSYDESMIKYYGRHGCKQFIRGKPIRFGYKVWSLNRTDGYLINFEIYQGKAINGNAEYDTSVGKCSSPLLRMLDELPDQIKNYPFKIFVDNLFTSHSLFLELKKRDYGCTGTVRKNRLPFDCPLDSETLLKVERGEFIYQLYAPENILYAMWKDNAVVTVASTSYGVHPVSKANRYSAQHKGKIQVTRPSLIAEYNRSMGGTDRMDQNIGAHRIGIRGKKFYWCIVTWIFDACMQNAWLLHKSSGGKLNQLEFRRLIAVHYIKVNGKMSKGSGRPKAYKMEDNVSTVLPSLRYDRMDHYVAQTVDNKRRRCAQKSCKSLGRTMCKKCDVGLCVKCFTNFHTSQ